jgi:hypothetical protein
MPRRPLNLQILELFVARKKLKVVRKIDQEQQEALEEGVILVGRQEIMLV